jgi:hypothetical protein
MFSTTPAWDVLFMPFLTLQLLCYRNVCRYCFNVMKYSECFVTKYRIVVECRTEDSSDDDVVMAKGNKGKGSNKPNSNAANETMLAKKVGRPTKEKAGLKKLPVKTKKSATEKKVGTTAEGRKQSTRVQRGKKTSLPETNVVVDEIKDLASFGIIPAATPNGQGLNQGNINTSALRVVILNGRKPLVRVLSIQAGVRS